MHTVCTVKWDFFLLEIGEIFCNVSALNLKRGYIYFDPKINANIVAAWLVRIKVQFGRFYLYCVLFLTKSTYITFRWSQFKASRGDLIPTTEQ